MFYVFANWKMNPSSHAEAQSLVRNILQELHYFDWQNKVKIILMPPFTWLNDIQKEIASSKLNIETGSQNIFWEDKGAYTGEISAPMVKSIGCAYTLIGHSEREIYLKEDLTMIIKKFQASLKNHLTPILCLHPKTQENLKELLKTITSNLGQNVDKVMYLYEPTTAISTQKGTVPSQEDIRKMRDTIKRHTAKKAKILYGGSIDDKNINHLTRETDLDGVLIGAKSLEADNFIQIIKNIK